MNYWFSWVLDCHPIWGVTLKCVFCEIRWAHLISELRMYSANAFFQVVADQRRGQTFNRWTKWMVTHQTNFSWQTSLFLEMSSSPEFVGHHSPMISFSLFSRPNGPLIILRCPWKEEHIEVVSEVCYLWHRLSRRWDTCDQEVDTAGNQQFQSFDESTLLQEYVHLLGLSGLNAVL